MLPKSSLSTPSIYGPLGIKQARWEEKSNLFLLLRKNKDSVVEIWSMSTLSSYLKDHLVESSKKNYMWNNIGF
jgi:hypothetical protein